MEVNALLDLAPFSVTSLKFLPDLDTEYINHVKANLIHSLASTKANVNSAGQHRFILAFKGVILSRPYSIPCMHGNDINSPIGTQAEAQVLNQLSPPAWQINETN